MKKVYFAMMYSQDGETAMPIIDSEGDCGYISHFATCTDPARFRK